MSLPLKVRLVTFATASVPDAVALVVARAGNARQSVVPSAVVDMLATDIDKSLARNVSDLQWLYS